MYCDDPLINYIIELALVTNNPEVLQNEIRQLTTCLNFRKSSSNFFLFLFPKSLQIAPHKT